MKAVLISIQPKWCDLIATGKKTVEVRKTRPKIATPFKCYIYCTVSNVHDCLIVNESETKRVATINYKTAIPSGGHIANGKVIGEFVCDEVKMSFVGYNENGCPSYWDILDGSCLTPNELVCYGEWKILYGWHISDLVIYEQPKELSEFIVERYPCLARLKRPPQSWCYIEHIAEKGGVE